MPDLLAQLKDIHTPPAVSWWPLAPGYWLLLLLLLVALFLWVKRYRRFRVRRATRHQFDALISEYQQHQNAQRLVQEISVLLRRAAISVRPRKEVAGITGAQWMQLLSDISGKKQHRFSDAVFATLTVDIHRPQSNGVIEKKVDQLILECRQWIETLPPTGLSS